MSQRFEFIQLHIPHEPCIIRKLFTVEYIDSNNNDDIDDKKVRSIFEEGRISETKTEVGITVGVVDV